MGFFFNGFLLWLLFILLEDFTGQTTNKQTNKQTKGIIKKQIQLKLWVPKTNSQHKGTQKGSQGLYFFLFLFFFLNLIFIFCASALTPQSAQPVSDMQLAGVSLGCDFTSNPTLNVCNVPMGEHFPLWSLRGPES